MSFSKSDRENGFSYLEMCHFMKEALQEGKCVVEMEKVFFFSTTATIFAIIILLAFYNLKSLDYIYGVCMDAVHVPRK